VTAFIQGTDAGGVVITTDAGGCEYSPEEWNELQQQIFRETERTLQECLSPEEYALHQALLRLAAARQER
jgi:hypothetical protein